jgi:hypothetical protein
LKTPQRTVLAIFKAYSSNTINPSSLWLKQPPLALRAMQGLHRVSALLMPDYMAYGGRLSKLFYLFKLPVATAKCDLSIYFAFKYYKRLYYLL